jgi:hypothetical protein
MSKTRNPKLTSIRECLAKHGGTWPESAFLTPPPSVRVVRQVFQRPRVWRVGIEGRNFVGIGRSLFEATQRVEVLLHG